jgi:hypothetical protein
METNKRMRCYDVEVTEKVHRIIRARANGVWDEVISCKFRMLSPVRMYIGDQICDNLGATIIKSITPD